MEMPQIKNYKLISPKIMMTLLRRMVRLMMMFSSPNLRSNSTSTKVNLMEDQSSSLKISFELMTLLKIVEDVNIAKHDGSEFRFVNRPEVKCKDDNEIITS